MSRNGANSSLSFRGMALWLRLREKFGDPGKRLEAAGLEEGQAVLDYGCGIGSYTIPAAQIVGPAGTVYALDIHPLAIDTVERRVRQEGLTNVRTIHSDRNTGLPDNSVDTVLLYDVLHAVPDQSSLLQELHRILKPGGLLSVLPDHMTPDELLGMIAAEDRFTLQAQHGEVFEFRKSAGT